MKFPALFPGKLMRAMRLSWNGLAVLIKTVVMPAGGQAHLGLIYYDGLKAQ